MNNLGWALVAYAGPVSDPERKFTEEEIQSHVENSFKEGVEFRVSIGEAVTNAKDTLPNIALHYFEILKNPRAKGLHDHFRIIYESEEIRLMFAPVELTQSNID
jgi:hypothetical protein